jgi:hypothetical protein
MEVDGFLPIIIKCSFKIFYILLSYFPETGRIISGMWFE